MSTTPSLPANAGQSTLTPLGQLLAYHARRDPERAAITCGRLTVTRAELEARCNKRARMLQGLGIGHDDLVTVALPNGIEFYETTFALWKLGATPNVISPKMPESELAATLAIANPKLVIGLTEAQCGGRKAIAANHPVDETLSGEPLESIVPRYWKAVASGGSTGRPKIIVDHMPGLWDPTKAELLQQVDDVVLNPGPLYHNAPFLGAHYALFAGAHLVEMEKFDPERALALISQHRVNWMNLVPTMMHRIWRLPTEVRAAADMSSIRVVFHMAAPCPHWLKQGWIDWLGPERIFELYAGTERQGATVISGQEWLARRGSVGRALPGSRIMIFDEAGQPCPPGEVGEIFFLPDDGRNATYHYLGAEAKAVDQWESIGDLGYLDDDGYLYLSDRRVDLIISGGANIYPAEVEGALEAHPNVLSCIVVGMQDDEWGQRVHAIVQTAPEKPVSEEELAAFAETRLTRYKIPREFTFVHEPLRDEAGKARRSALLEALRKDVSHP